MNRPDRAMIRAATGPRCRSRSRLPFVRRRFRKRAGGLWEAAEGREHGATDLRAGPTCSHNTSIASRTARECVPRRASRPEIHYTCTGGAFGQTTVHGLLTPSSLRIENQGISDNAPFHDTASGTKWELLNKLPASVKQGFNQAQLGRVVPDLARFSPKSPSARTGPPLHRDRRPFFCRRRPPRCPRHDA